MNPVLPHPQLTCIWMLWRPIGFDVRTQYTLISAPPPLRKTVSSPMTGPIPSRKRAKTAPTRSAVAPSLSTSPVGFNLVDLGSLATQILAAQADSSLQLHQSFQINMLENIRATSTLLGELVAWLAMSATCRRQGEMSPIFVPTGEIWRHGFLCVGTLLCRDFLTLAGHEQTIFGCAWY
jgi:hypothetical protein